MTTTQSPTKSEIFAVYNKARAAARTGALDLARVNRALGYLQSGEAQQAWEKYHTTTKACDCPDHTYRHQTCKHIISLMIWKRIEQRRAAAA